ncbi:CpaF family protein [Neobacillus sp.]|uniref:CpaF family protein n=1 Tax=Neobacillus sp. TaxID=2675273 RepID=UPI00289A3D35|nr:CpaF family protein [Neobacillus sp.]
MSLLVQIQEKNNQINGGSQKTDSSLESPTPSPMLDFVTLFREQRPKEKMKEQVKERKVDINQELKNNLHKKILHELKKKDIGEIVPKLDGLAIEMIKENKEFRGQMDRKKVVDELITDLPGFGPINPLLLDEDVSEVMVNGPDQVYCERKGKLLLTPIRFRDNEHVISVIKKIVSPLGRRIDEGSPMVDARLPDGSRVNAIIPPLALNGPTITIRKFSKAPLLIKDIINLGTMTEEMAIFLDACVKARLNMFVSGGTGSGKTTTLNVLSNLIPEDERIVTIEDAAEIQLGQEHVVSLESCLPNIEGKGAISIRELVRTSLRMRPDRVIIGEVRGEEALDMLQAMNTGHDGLLATGHSKSPGDMISRLETMVMLAGVDLPVKAIRKQITGAIDVIIHQSRLKDGSRKIVSITEVQGMEEDVIVLQDIFTFKQEGLNSEGKIIGRLVPTGVRPKFYERLEASGIHIPASVFISH